MNSITFLGTGTSTGIPEIACDCNVCTSDDQRDKRLRSSALVHYQGKNLLIDCGPDFRMQMINNNVSDVDAILITHEHYDHTGGLDDVRPLFHRSHECPIYAERNVITAVQRRLPYAFVDHKYPGVPNLEMKPLEIGIPIMLPDEGEILPLRIMHGKLPIVGFRFGTLAYITDCKTIPDESMELLQGVELLALNSLRAYDHPAHLTIGEAIELSRRIGAKRTFLTHFAHTLGTHEEITAQCPEGILPAYDGLKIDF